MVRLLPKGLEALEAEEKKGSDARLMESMIETNESIRETNALQQQNIQAQERLTKRALWIAAAAAAIALAGLIKDLIPRSEKAPVTQTPMTDSLLKSQSRRIDSLSRQIQTLDSITRNAMRPHQGKKD
jgi:hypothetical protein